VGAVVGVVPYLSTLEAGDMVKISFRSRARIDECNSICFCDVHCSIFGFPALENVICFV
jgi:hypothetical protein